MGGVGCWGAEVVVVMVGGGVGYFLAAIIVSGLHKGSDMNYI